jgi:hypothetical protein
MERPMPDDLLTQMSHAAREHALADARWADYARGTLAKDEEADLLAKAREAGLDDAAIEALGPRPEAFDEALAGAALAALAPVIAPANDNAPPARSRRVLFASAGVLLAAAAGAALLLRPSADLPAYAMAIEGGTKDVRSSSGDTGALVKLAPDNHVVISVRPEARVDGRVAARLYLLGPAGALEVRVPVEIADSGAVRVAATASDLLRGAGAGTWDLCVAVGRAETLPAAPITTPLPARGHGFTTVCRKVEWPGEPGGR